MAMAPMAAPAPPADTEAPAAPTVLMTIMDNHDGTVTLVMGDEPEEGPMEEAGEPGGVPPPAPGMPPMGGAPMGAAAPPPMEAPAPEEPVGDVYDPQTLGDMLDTIMKQCDDAMGAGGGETRGNEEADMMAGFGAGAPA